MMKNAKDLIRAIDFAMTYHEGQVDKGGAPYVLHPIRVMIAVHKLNPGLPIEGLIAAVLHDVLEDTDATIGDIEVLFGEEVANTIALLTKIPYEPNDLYYDRLKEYDTAAWIKLADLQDNLDVTRLTSFTEKDAARVARYKVRERELLEHLGEA